VLRSSPTADFEAVLGGTGLTQLVNLTALIEGSQILLTRASPTQAEHHCQSLGHRAPPEQQTSWPARCTLTPRSSKPELYRHSRWR